MLYYALIFFLLVLVSGFLGFGGIAETASSVAQILFFVFPMALAISVVFNGFSGRHPSI